MIGQNLIRRQCTGALICLVLLPGAVNAADFAIASAHPLATEAGIEILASGGNAFDAAIAVTSTLAVVEPYSSGIGGGGFYLLHQQKTNRQVMLDARERAPLKATRDFYLDTNGAVDHDRSMNGATSAGIPGIPAALDYLQKNYGLLPLEQTLSRAIQYADNGFPVDATYRRLAKFRLPVLQRFESTRQTLLHDGQIPELGSLLKQPDLARTLRTMSAEGADGFYQGEVAQKLVASVQANGGIWSLQDLNQYQVVERDPVRFHFGSAQFVTASLPSSGGVVLASIFNMLEILGYAQAGDTQRLHLLVEAMRRAYRDRAAYLGDVDYVDVPVQRLTSKAYARQLAKDISILQASRSADIGTIGEETGGNNTTHFSIIDQQGNMVAATLSINYPFGSGLVAGSTGVLLNDEMDDFSAKPGVPNAYGLLGSTANAIQPGKRMLSSMTPAFVHKAGKSLISGTPGGSRIITMQLLGMLEFLRGGSASDIVSLPRFHHQYFPDQISFEDNAFDQATQESLRDLGHELKQMSYRYGNMQAIIVDHETGTLDAASDPRGIGSAIVSSSGS
ncbi:MAG: gamma-glutamyltransferase [Gammaproteobacteria bacterium]|nr:MAG: gamma-glutamyltransferase [Gammaproteobacteria bacterium]